MRGGRFPVALNVGDHSGAKTGIGGVPPGGKAFEQRGQSLPGVLIAIVVGSEIGRRSKAEAELVSFG